MAVFTGRVIPAWRVRALELDVARVAWSRVLAWLAIALLLALAVAILLVQTPGAVRAAEPVGFASGPAGPVYAVPEAANVSFPPQDDRSGTSF